MPLVEESMVIKIPGTKYPVHADHPSCADGLTVKDAADRIAAALPKERPPSLSRYDTADETGEETEIPWKEIITFAIEVTRAIWEHNKRQEHANCAAAFVLIPKNAYITGFKAYLTNPKRETPIGAWNAGPGHVRWAEETDTRVVRAYGREYLLVTKIMQNWKEGEERGGYFECYYVRP